VTSTPRLERQPKTENGFATLIDVRGPERRDDPFWTTCALLCLRPLPTLQTMNAPLLAVFGELDTPEGVKLMCVRSGKSWIRRDAGITPLKVYSERCAQPDGGSSDNPTSLSASNDSHQASLKDGRLGDNTASPHAPARRRPLTLCPTSCM